MPNSQSTNPYLNGTQLDLAYAVGRLVQLGQTNIGRPKGSKNKPKATVAKAAMRARKVSPKMAAARKLQGVAAALEFVEVNQAKSAA